MLPPLKARSPVLVAASAEAGRPVAYPDQASLEQYGTKTWLASAKCGFSDGSADRIPPTVLTDGHLSDDILWCSRLRRSEQLKSS